MEALAYILIFLSFLISASAGMGGSLLLIPTLSYFIGVRDGIIISSVLLALNNCFKIIVFFKYIQLRKIIFLMCFMLAGAIPGSMLMLKIDENILAVILFINIIFAFIIEKNAVSGVRKKISWMYSWLSGFCSGISGTSGPLKGMAIKCLELNKLQIVAAASVLSFATDSTRAVIYLSNYNPLAGTGFNVLLGSICMMPVATVLGKRINHKISDVAYDVLFFSVLSGYAVRLVL
jgi:uncharacterized protein